MRDISIGGRGVVRNQATPTSDVKSRTLCFRAEVFAPPPPSAGGMPRRSTPFRRKTLIL